MRFPPVAIVGRGCVLPGAESPSALWDLVASGGCALTHLAEGRWGVPLDAAVPRHAPHDVGGYVASPGNAEQWTLEAVRQALAEAGLQATELEVLTPEPSSIALGSELFSQLMRQAPDVDGIFFCNDDLAQGAVLQALRQGVEVPRQVAMVGFNDLPASAHMVPRLTSIRTPRAAVGRGAAQALLALLDGKRVPNAQQDLGFELMVRESS